MVRCNGGVTPSVVDINLLCVDSEVIPSRNKLSSWWLAQTLPLYSVCYLPDWTQPLIRDKLGTSLKRYVFLRQVIRSQSYSHFDRLI